MDNVAGWTTCRFDEFLIDMNAGVLLRLAPKGGTTPIPLGSRAFDILCLLVKRAGSVVPKQEIMETVWPDVSVEDGNLTVQISTLRRILDAGRAQGSCLQTIPGRGYRFVLPVTWATEQAGSDVPNAFGSRSGSAAPSGAEAHEPAAGAAAAGASRGRAEQPKATPSRGVAWLLRRFPIWAIPAATVVGLLLGGHAWYGSRTQVAFVAPRLSIVVLPFQNLGGGPGDDYLADGITDDLTSDLSHIPQTFVIANASARKYKGRDVDPKEIGRELGVRYMLEGSVRRVGPALRVNAQLIETGAGVHVWSDRFDEPIADLANGQDAILARLRGVLGLSLVEIEVARGQREPASSPDAFDLTLRARALSNQPNNEARGVEMKRLYEQALRLDPSSVLAMTGMVRQLAAESSLGSGWASVEKRRRAEALLTRATTIAPGSEAVLEVTAYWLHYEPEGCREAIPAAERLIERFPNQASGYTILGWCKTVTGSPEEEIVLVQKAIQLNPADPNLYYRYRRMGYAAVLLGRYQEAVPWLKRALALNPEASKESLSSTYHMLAAALAHAGRLEEARGTLATVEKIWRFDTVRIHSPDSLNPDHMAQMRLLQDGLRLAGERDHADADADFGVPPDVGLRSEMTGYTPLALLGARTIRTGELLRFIDERKPVIIDPLAYFWGSSLPGAIGLRYAGLGGDFADDGQERLRRKMTELTGGDLTKPIVAVGWNSERFDGRNLALRLVALGYTNVVWYRGGREAWEVAGLPETDLVPQEW